MNLPGLVSSVSELRREPAFERNDIVLLIELRNLKLILIHLLNQL